MTAALKNVEIADLPLWQIAFRFKLDTSKQVYNDFVNDLYSVDSFVKGPDRAQGGPGPMGPCQFC